MSKYRIFTARWWDDSKNTVPITMPRRKRTVRTVETIEEARAICKQGNEELRAKYRNGKVPFGQGYEFDTI